MAPDLDRIGPYRLDRRLGAGGMGEVYLAYDEQLDRQVAVKYIRPESAGRPEARQRFRREAKAAAALSHPATVQIYHVLETPEGDAIVMEYIEGETLASMLRRGHLPVRRALRLAREITSGLAAAHARGILHRDLKPENVMVTSGGHAKILDFGLAKSLDPRHEDSEQLSHAGGVLGTYAAMSPEQARAQELDPRSDLFSLGLLFYRMFTGRHPFAANNPVDTLTQICTQQQLAASLVKPDVPEELSQLIDQMLEKDPPRRPESTQVVLAELKRISSSASLPREGSDSGISDVSEMANSMQHWVLDQPTWDEHPSTRVGGPVSPSATTAIYRPEEPIASRDEAADSRKRRGIWVLVLLLVAGALLGALWWLRREPVPPLYVAVMPPQVSMAANADAEEEALLASSVELALTHCLIGRDRLAVVLPDQIQGISGTALEIARTAAVDELFTSQLECFSESCNLTLRRMSGRDGSLLWTERLAVLREKPYALPEILEVYVARAYPRHRAERTHEPLAVSETDYEEYLQVYTQFMRQEGAGLPIGQVLGRLANVRERSPQFLEAYLFAARLNGYHFMESRDAADVETALELLSQASNIAPLDPRPLKVRFDIALQAQRIDLAVATLNELERLQPGDTAVLIRRANLYRRMGRTAEALALMRRVVEQHPSRDNLFSLAQVEIQVGDNEAARRTLEDLLSRSSNSYTALSLLANLELVDGGFERATEIYRQLVERSPQVTELSNLSLGYMLQQRWAQAEQSARQALELEPKNAFITLNLADALELLGRSDEARQLYEKVLVLVEQDPAAGDWQLLTVKAQALAHLSKSAEAVQAIEQALTLAPEDTLVYFEASLVYELIGMRVEAREHAKRALRALDERWFSLPWFDELRRDPEMGTLLGA